MWHASTSWGCLDIQNICGGVDTFAAICLPKYLPGGVPTLRGASQAKQTHSVQVCPIYVAFISILKIMLTAFSYICIYQAVHLYCTSFVLRTLFHISLEVVRLAVLVKSLPGYLIKLPPAVIQMQWGSIFWRRKSMTMHAYVNVCPSGMWDILS